MFGNYYTLLWTVLIILFTVIEAATLGLTSIWFAVGALASLIASVMGFNIVTQVIVFIIVALVLLIYTRPIAKKVLKVGHNKTNADALIGKTGFVTKIIQPHETGLVKVSGQIWTAKCVDNDIINVDENVEILAIEGVKLIVKRN
jgi:membrane protein implicated in regulation of membrane protease activity